MLAFKAMQAGNEKSLPKIREFFFDQNPTEGMLHWVLATR